MLSLMDLAGYDFIVIQCHDNPDVDAIGSGYALLRYFEDAGIKARLVYGGFNQVTKPNISEFISCLSIPLAYVGKTPPALPALAEGAGRPLLLMVDCQYGAGNVTSIQAQDVCVIDHHLPEGALPAQSRVEPYLGSCATVVWRMLAEAGFDLKGRRDVSTALYYGLYTDTNSLSELYHPIDRDMLESLDFDVPTVRWLKNNNLTRSELVIAGNALIEARYDEQLGTNLFMTEPCDPNILGFINDLSMQAQGVQVCVGFCENNGGIKLSVRSATSEVMANELAAFLTDGTGSGGGNREKAGGFLRLPQGADAPDYLSKRLRAYYASFDKVDPGTAPVDTAGMQPYRKLPVTVGYARLADIFEAGTHVNVRTLEGDANFTVSADIYIMVGVQGEVYPIGREKFERSYTVLPGRFTFPTGVVDDGFYEPAVKDRLYERSVSLMPHIRPCVARSENRILARPLVRNTKVFAKWYEEGYMFGRPGDWLAVRGDDKNDAYVIAQKIFGLTYTPE